MNRKYILIIWMLLCIGALWALFAHNKPDAPAPAKQETVKKEEVKTIILTNGETEFMRFLPDGKIYVKGQLTASDTKVYETFKTWLATGCK